MLTLEEEGSLVSNQVTRKVLRSVHQASDDGTPQISALDKIGKLGIASLMGLNLDSSLHHGKCLLGGGLGSILARKALDGLESLVLASAADEPPGGLGGEPDEDHQGDLHLLVTHTFDAREVLLTGKTHCRARGPRQAHSSLRLLKL
jgi:hypothetical protein